MAFSFFGDFAQKGNLVLYYELYLIYLLINNKYKFKLKKNKIKQKIIKLIITN